MLETAADYCVTSNTTLQQLALATVALCMDTSPYKTDIVLGVPHINRDTSDDLNTFGLFLQPLPVRVRYEADTEESFLDAVKASSQAALSHAMPWHRLLRHLEVETKYPNHPLFDIMVTMHDFRKSNDLDMGLPGFEPSLVWSQGAKFKLMCEFTALPSNKLLLRLEYDPNVVAASQIEQIQKAIPLAIRLIASAVGHAEIKHA